MRSGSDDLDERSAIGTLGTPAGGDSGYCGEDGAGEFVKVEVLMLTALGEVPRADVFLVGVLI
jgi:hypothetical protein